MSSTSAFVQASTADLISALVRGAELADQANTMTAAIYGIFRLVTRSVCLCLRSMYSDSSSRWRNESVGLITGLVSALEVTLENGDSRMFSQSHRYLLGNGQTDSVGSWDAVTEIILTIPSLRHFKELEGFCGKMNASTGFGWAMSLRVSSLFNSRDMKLPGPEVKAKRMRFFINFCDIYFQTDEKRHFFKSINECLLLPEVC